MQSFPNGYCVYHCQVGLIVGAFASHTGDRDSIPGREKPKSCKIGMGVSLSNARQLSWVLGNAHI